MKRYMLDTNTVSFLVRRHPVVMQRMSDMPVSSVCISSVTKAELLYGLEKNPAAKRYLLPVRNFIQHADAIPWGDEAAESYAALRTRLERDGRNLGALDLMIAAHALSVHAVLVTNDSAIKQVSGLEIEDWSQSM